MCEQEVHSLTVRGVGPMKIEIKNNGYTQLSLESITTCHAEAFIDSDGNVFVVKRNGIYCLNNGTYYKLEGNRGMLFQVQRFCDLTVIAE